MHGQTCHSINLPYDASTRRIIYVVYRPQEKVAEDAAVMDAGGGSVHSLAQVGAVHSSFIQVCHFTFLMTQNEMWQVRRWSCLILV